MGIMHKPVAGSHCEMKTDHEAAHYLGISVSTVRRWRLTGGGPRWIRIGSSIRYSSDDLASFVASLPSGGGISMERR